MNEIMTDRFNQLSLLDLELRRNFYELVFASTAFTKVKFATFDEYLRLRRESRNAINIFDIFGRRFLEDHAAICNDLRRLRSKFHFFQKILQHFSLDFSIQIKKK